MKRIRRIGGISFITYA